MVAFDSVVQRLAGEQKRDGVDQGSVEKVIHLNQLLNQALN
jgi:hypothetical protein